MRSPVVFCDHTRHPASNGKTKTKFFTVFSPDKLFLPVTNLDVAVERVEFQLGAAVAHAHAKKTIAFENEFPVVLLARRRPAGQSSDFKIGVGAAVEGFQPEIRRKIGTKADLHVAVERPEI